MRLPEEVFKSDSPTWIYRIRPLGDGVTEIVTPFRYADDDFISVFDKDGTLTDLAELGRSLFSQGIDVTKEEFCNAVYAHSLSAQHGVYVFSRAIYVPSANAMDMKSINVLATIMRDLSAKMSQRVELNHG